MNLLKKNNLLKILFLELIVLLFMLIIRECKITSFCITILKLISPIFVGYIIAWLIKPIKNYFNKKYSNTLSLIFTYLSIVLVLGVFSIFLIPLIVKEFKNIIPIVTDLYYNLPSDIKSKIDLSKVSIRLLNITSNIKDIIISLFYSIFISYYFLVDSKLVNKIVLKYFPISLLSEINYNMRMFIKGTIYDTVILFVLTIISFSIAGMPNALLFAILTSITNVIPFVGPYIGGIPSVVMAFTVSKTLGIVIACIIIVLQFIESTFIHPIILSKSMNLHPILILIGLIVFGHFFGIIGMLISTPLTSIIKSLIDYYKPFRKLQYRFFC